MDESSVPDNSQTSNPHHENNTESSGYSLDCEMPKRQNHYKYDTTSTKKEYSFGFRLPKFSFISLRRSWNLKLIFLMVASSVFVACLYSGMFSLSIPSFSFNLSLEQSDRIRVPRIAIEVQERGLNHGPRVSEEYVPESIMNKNGTKGERRFPSCIIFGVSKCGTRAVLEYLKLHPDVVAPMAEINFFNNETLFSRGAKWYLQQMPLARNHQMVVEKSPDYFQTPECAPMVRRMNSSIKLLLLLRDPVERLVSQYMQLLAKNSNLPSFEEWVIHPVSGNVNTNIRSVMVSAYAKYLETWLSIFPDNQILIIESSKLRQDPLAEMKRVEKFLNLKPYFVPTDFYFNSTRGFYCLRYRSTGKTKCLGKSKGRPHISVNKDVLQLLSSFYEPYNRRLNELLETKFPWS